MDSLLLEAIVCPQCQGELKYTKEGVLVCLPCRLGYPVDNQVPDLRSVAAFPLKASIKGGVGAIKTRILIDITREDESFQSYLEPRTCRVVGRNTFDEGGTQLITSGGMLPLDDGIKKIVTGFIKKQDQIKSVDVHTGFERLPDISVNDLGVSRLHAMIFFDGAQLGILDLVSRNGTFINDSEIESAYLTQVDVVRMGHTLIKIH